MTIGFKNPVHQGYKAAQIAERAGKDILDVVNPYPRMTSARREFEDGAHRYNEGRPWLDPKVQQYRHTRQYA